MLRKRNSGVASGPRLSRALASGPTGGAIDRRTFLRQSGLTAGGLAAAGALGGTMVRKAEAVTAPAAAGGEVQVIKSVCGHCSVAP